MLKIIKQKEPEPPKNTLFRDVVNSALEKNPPNKRVILEPMWQEHEKPQEPIIISTSIPCSRAE